MNICLINTTQFWGGGEKWFYQNAVFLSQSGFKVCVLAHRNGRLWKKLENFKAIELSHLEVKNLSFFNPNKKQALRSYFRRTEVETVIINASPEVKLCAPVAKSAGVSHIIYRRGSALPVKNTLLNSWIFGKMVSHVITNSLATKQTFLQNLNGHVLENRVTVIPNGVELPVGISNTAQKVFTIGTLGRLTYQKGYDYAITIALKLKSKGLAFKWLFAGGGNQKDELLALVKQHKLESYIEFLDEISDIYSFFNQIDVYVHTARWEGFGYAIAEAMAHKKSVIAFDISSNPELVVHGQTGLLSPFEDIDAISQQIRSVYKNYDLLNEMGENAYNLIAQKFTQAKQFKQLAEYLKSL
ncbi:MAG: glycosyltransferase family 4 protein [Bacteroidia bacterium]